jgi:hypothetical protein
VAGEAAAQPDGMQVQSIRKCVNVDHDYVYPGVIYVYGNT